MDDYSILLFPKDGVTGNYLRLSDLDVLCGGSNCARAKLAELCTGMKGICFMNMLAGLREAEGTDIPRTRRAVAWPFAYPGNPDRTLVELRKATDLLGCDPPPLLAERISRFVESFKRGRVEYVPGMPPALYGVYGALGKAEGGLSRRVGELS